MNQMFRVLNLSREELSGLAVCLVDTTSDPYKKLIEELAAQADVGLWLKPYRGIPAWPGLPPFDLLYLDDGYCVVQEVETYPNPQAKPFNPLTASALVLPRRTLFASRAQTGDRLEFSPADETTQWRQDFSSSRGYQGTALQSRVPSAHPNSGIATSNPSPGDQRTGNLKPVRQSSNEGAGSPQLSKKASLTTRFLRWFEGKTDRADRRALPDLVAYHWTGGAPIAYRIANISKTGIYLLTDERPFLGTIVLMTLQRTGTGGTNPADSLPVRTEAVRWGPDGVGFSFVLARTAADVAENATDAKTLQAFLKRLDLLD